MTLNPTSLSFGNQNVGTTSGAKGIQLKNTGNSTLTISSIAISETNATDFAQTNNCPSSLAPRRAMQHQRELFADELRNAYCFA